MAELSPAAELLTKYEEMVRLQYEQAVAPTRPDGALRALSQRFPGALRELDRRSTHEITQRLVHLRALLAGSQEAEPWVVIGYRFHVLMRAALWAKTWLRGRQATHPATLIAYQNACDTAAAPADSMAWLPRLALVAKPPGGRLTQVVVDELAREFSHSSAYIWQVLS